MTFLTIRVENNTGHVLVLSLPEERILTIPPTVTTGDGDAD